jgi:hypothetical protein
MKRVKITNNESAWFNPDAAILYVKENTYWDGHNWISKATGEQWRHDALYYTKSGKFVLHHYSNYQGEGEVYNEVTASDVVTWIIKNEFDDLNFLDVLPDDVKAKVLHEIEQSEI